MDIAKIAEKLGTDRKGCTDLVAFLQECEAQQKEYDNWMEQNKLKIAKLGFRPIRTGNQARPYAPDHPLWIGRKLLEEVILEDGYMVEMGNPATLYIFLKSIKKISLNVLSLVGTTRPDEFHTCENLQRQTYLRLWWD